MTRFRSPMPAGGNPRPYVPEPKPRPEHPRPQIPDSPGRARLRKISRTIEIFRNLRDDILSGHLEPGSQLPSMHTIAQEYGVSETVAQDAAARLRLLGLVRTEPGRGTWVVDAITDKARMRGVLSALREGLHEPELFGPDAGELVTFPVTWLERLLDPRDDDGEPMTQPKGQRPVLPAPKASKTLPRPKPQQMASHDCTCRGQCTGK